MEIYSHERGCHGVIGVSTEEDLLRSFLQDVEGYLHNPKRKPVAEPEPLKRGHYECPYCHTKSDMPLNNHQCWARPR